MSHIAFFSGMWYGGGMKIGIVFIIIWIFLILLFSNKVISNLESNGSYEPCQTSGHPLWVDC